MTRAFILLLALGLAACGQEQGSKAKTKSSEKKTKKATVKAEDDEDVVDDEDEEPKAKKKKEASVDDSEGEDDDWPEYHADKEPEEEPADVELSLTFKWLGGVASDVHCVSFGFNGNAPEEFGCNGFLAKAEAAKPMKLKAKPFCNVVRIVDADKSRSVELSSGNSAQLKWGDNLDLTSFLGMNVFTPTAGLIVVRTNDNGDTRADADVHVQLGGLETVDYTVENSNSGCKPK